MSHAFGVSLPFVIVEWDDAWSSATDEVDMDGAVAAHKATRTFDAGWLVVDNEKGVQLSGSVSPKETTPYGRRKLIPRQMIIAVHPIKLSKPRIKKKKPPPPDVAPPNTP